MPLVLYNENTHISLNTVNTYIYIYSEIQHTYKHSYMVAILAQIQCFLLQAHTLSHAWTLWAALAFLSLGNPSLVHEESTRCASLDMPASTYQPRRTTHDLC